MPLMNEHPQLEIFETPPTEAAYTLSCAQCVTRWEHASGDSGCAIHYWIKDLWKLADALKSSSSRVECGRNYVSSCPGPDLPRIAGRISLPVAGINDFLALVVRWDLCNCYRICWHPCPPHCWSRWVP